MRGYSIKKYQEMQEKLEEQYLQQGLSEELANERAHNEIRPLVDEFTAKAIAKQQRIGRVISIASMLCASLSVVTTVTIALLRSLGVFLP